MIINLLFDQNICINNYFCQGLTVRDGSARPLLASSAGKFGHAAEMTGFQANQAAVPAVLSVFLCWSTSGSSLKHLPCGCQEQQCPFQDDLSSFLSPLSCDLDFEATGETSPVSCDWERDQEPGGCGVGASRLQSCSRDSVGNAGVTGGGQEVGAGGGCDAGPLHILPGRCF